VLIRLFLLFTVVLLVELYFLIKTGALIRGRYYQFRVRQGQRHRLKDNARIGIVSRDSRSWPTTGLQTGLLSPASFTLYNPNSKQ